MIRKGFNLKEQGLYKSKMKYTLELLMRLFTPTPPSPLYNTTVVQIDPFSTSIQHFSPGFLQQKTVSGLYMCIYLFEFLCRLNVQLIHQISLKLV